VQNGKSRWLETLGENFVRRIGLKPGQTVVDFGCSQGNYSIPAAKVVGNTGRVYALDRDREALRELAKLKDADGLSNVIPILIAKDQQIPLHDCSADVVLLYDVFHRAYLPEMAERQRLLQRLYRIVKPRGQLSCYPTHMRKYGLTVRQVLAETEKAGFELREEHRRRLLHDNVFVRGRVFEFMKNAARDNCVSQEVAQGPQLNSIG